ncbi:MAG: pilus assembly protein TadG-related protein [Hyphomicrobium sp.]|nr:pilus assembly protein TadG-related protein [Hyphomicrobium sp.]
MLRQINSHLSRFRDDKRGSIAILFALMFSVMLLMVGIAVDHARIVHSQSKMMAAADAAALAAGTAMLDARLSDDDVREVGRRYFDANLREGGEYADIRDVRFDLNRTSGTVTVNVDADIPLTVTRVAGYTSFEMPVESATAYDQRDIELGMALDITGSMSGRKISDLKSAAKDLIDILLSDQGRMSKIRIGLAPYSASIKLGTTFAAAASNRRSTDGCVRERTGAQAYTDAAPGTGAYYSAGGSPRDIDGTEGTQAYVCPSATLRPLSTDKAALKASIDTYSANGATAGHIGTQWAWNLVSPEWSNVWPTASKPAAYGAANTIKAVIVMTDGIYNVAYANGNASTQALSLCDGMKAKDIVVYTVAFQSPTAAENLLKQCASNENTFFKADDGDQLRAAFQQIALRLNNLRLTN